MPPSSEVTDPTTYMDVSKQVQLLESALEVLMHTLRCRPCNFCLPLPTYSQSCSGVKKLARTFAQS